MAAVLYGLFWVLSPSPCSFLGGVKGLIRLHIRDLFRMLYIVKEPEVVLGQTVRLGAIPE